MMGFICWQGPHQVAVKSNKTPRGAGWPASAATRETRSKGTLSIGSTPREGRRGRVGKFGRETEFPRENYRTKGRRGTDRGAGTGIARPERREIMPWCKRSDGK